MILVIVGCFSMRYLFQLSCHVGEVKSEAMRDFMARTIFSIILPGLYLV